MKKLSLLGAVAVLSVLIAGLVGCGVSVSGPAVSTSPVVVATGAGGTVYGGSQAISNASIQLWTVGTTANASGAVGLLPTGSYTAAGVAGCVASATQVCYPTSVTTTSSGGFSLATQFNCSSAPNQLVYLTATGGNPGLAAGTNNTAIQLMTAIGPCSNLVAGSKWQLNEATTVASVYSLMAYMGSTGSVGSTAANAANLTAAFAMVNNLVNTSTGYPQLVVDNNTELAPQAEIDTLANVLATCVNSTGSMASGQPCASLASAATGSITVQTTLQAALNVANNPSDNVFGLASTSGPFQPTLSGAPSSWTVTLSPVAPANVATSSLPTATVGTSYSQQLIATGGAGQYSWSITGGQSALAGAGIALSSSGLLYGTPGSSGSYPITVQVTDGPTGLTGTANLTLTIASNANTSGCGSTYAGAYAGSTISVSGTVTYTGTKTGRIYLMLEPTCGSAGGSTGTSISSAGTFTIRGLPPNTTYVLQAFMDTLGYGVPNTVDPTGSVSVTVGSGSASGVSLALSDPGGTVSPNSAFSLSSVTAFNNGVIVFYKESQYITSSGGVEAATSYILQWSTSSSFSSIAGSKTFPAIGTHSAVWFVNGLTNGNAYYFRAAPIVGGVTLGYATLSSPVTINAPTGMYTVSGSVSFPVAASGPLYVGYLNNFTGGVYLQYIANPTSAQAYSIQLPSGSYQPIAIIDQNNNGVVDAGDLQDVVQSQGNNVVTISGNTTGASITLPGTNAVGAVETQHYVNGSGATNYYYLQFSVQNGLKQPVAATLVSGPNITGPIDIALCGQIGSSCGSGFQILTNSGLNTPNVGDTYTYNVTYSDGTSGAVTAAVTAVLNGFASNLAPTGTGGSKTPTFTWTDPANASNYTYGFEIGVTNGSLLWQIPSDNGNLYSSTTSVVWGTDPLASGNTPSVSTLTDGTNYSWSIFVYDIYGNQAITQVNYTPTY
jgi:hypothetical protein